MKMHLKNNKKCVGVCQGPDVISGLIGLRDGKMFLTELKVLNTCLVGSLNKP